MKVMMLVKATPESEAGVMPKEALITEMMKFNEQLGAAGVLRELAGLHPTSAGARVYFDGDQRTVVDGPFAESKELIAGFWILEVKSLAEAIAWAKRAPNPYPETGHVELRPFFELDEFEEVTPETAARAAKIEAALKA